MRFYPIILSIFFNVLISHCVRGQGQISVEFSYPVKDTVISIYTPIAGVFNKDLVTGEIKVNSRNGTFKILTPIEKPGFVTLKSKSMPKTIFYVEPGGEVKILLLKDESGRTKAKYSGSHANANNILADESPMDNQNFLQYKLPEIFQNVSAQAFVDIMSRELESSTQPFNFMLKKKKITQQCYDVMMRETEQTMLHWVSMYLKNFLMPDVELSYVTKLDRDEVKKLARMLYSKYDPFHSKYAGTTKTYQNQMTKSVLIDENVLDNKKEVKPVWTQFEDDFSMTVSRLSAIDQAPDTIQMTFMGTTLLSALAYRSMSEEKFNKVFSVYQRKFPNSQFIPVIVSQLSSNPGNSSNTKIVAGETHYSENESDGVLLRKEFVDVSQIENLKDLIKKNFVGKTVFVDFWATWCAPCIAEFQNEPTLRKFLDEKHIVTLYVSIDSPKETSKWEKAIDKYKLSGYHCLVNKEIKDSLDKWFSGIPRYMLFDSTGELVDDNLPKPSTKTELYERITQLVK